MYFNNTPKVEKNQPKNEVNLLLVVDTLPKVDYNGYIIWGSIAGIDNTSIINNYNNLVVLDNQSVTINNPSGYSDVTFFAGSVLNWYVVGLK